MKRISVKAVLLSVLVIIAAALFLLIWLLWPVIRSAASGLSEQQINFALRQEKE